MKNRFLPIILLALTSMTIMACDPTSSSLSLSIPTSSSEVTTSSEEPSSSEVALSTITFSGADDIELDFDEMFNALTGVTAIGNNEVDYTDQITLQSTSDAVDLTTGDVDTTQVGTHAIRYNVTVGTVIAQKWRNVVVKNPEVVEGEMLINPDFSLGTAGWDDPSVLYNMDGGNVDLSVEDGALKAEVVAGWNPYTPRFGQMNVPFEIDTTYEISFEAKSSVEKKIQLQLGELLSGPPYFTDFLKPELVYRTITTSWATYSFKFTQKIDNQLGGLIVALGQIDGQQINATMWFDNFSIEEAIPDPDTAAPVFSGITAERNVNVGTEFDPMTGVSAYDLVDGDVTDKIVVTIKDSLDNTVSFVDTSVPGVFTVTYTVEDLAGNIATETMTVNVVSMLFKETNLIANPSFEQPFNATTPEWDHWQQDGYWATPAPVVEYTLDTEAGTYSIDITGGGDASWAIQVFQDNVLTLEQGKTYRLQLDAFSTAARPVNFAFGYNYGDNQFEEYARENAVMINTVSGTSEFIFTVTKPTHAVKFVIELGSQPGFVDSTVVLEEVRLQEHDAEPIIENSDFSLAGWRGFHNFWDGTEATYGIVDGEYKIDITKFNPNGEVWALQLIQDEVSMGGDTENGVIDLTPGATYTISFDAYASEAMSIHPFIISSGDWANLVTAPGQTVAITTTKTTYEVTAVAGATVYGNEVLKFQFGDIAGFSDKTLSIMFDNITVKDSTNTPLSSVYNSDMETVLGGHRFDSPQSAANTMKRSDDGAVFTIVDVGTDAWVPHYYYMIDVLEPGAYAAVFELSATVARDLRFNIVLPDAGYSSILPENAYDFNVPAGSVTRVVIPFTIVTTVTNAKVELDFGTLGGTSVSVPTVITMNSMLVYRNYNAA